MNEMFMENNVFPLPFEIHLVFVCIAIVLFIFRYASCRRMYQLLICIAAAATLLLYMNTSKLWFNIVGIIELALMIGALVSSILDRKKLKEQSTDEAAE
ncbi:MAG: hypothetical protein IJA12_04410 [Oscillospiraceae bacterium]|nr:hypothetical protein [Oscillospiraceae bacterium]